MKTSIVIPSYNGCAKLPKILKSIINQSYSPFETVIVVDGSTDKTLELLDKYSELIPDIVIVKQDNQGRSAARNNGALKAKGDLLIFVDDDMGVGKNWVSDHVDHHAKHSETILAGAVSYSPNIEKENPDIYNFLANKWHLSKPEGNQEKNGKSSRRLTPHLSAQNFSIPKKLFIDLGRFDGTLTDGEDFDLANKAFEKDISIYESSENFASAEVEVLPSFKEICTRNREYFKAGDVLLEKYPERYASFFEDRKKSQKSYKKFFFSLFCNQHIIDSVDKKKWLFLPEILRFQLYSWIVTANASYFPKKVDLK
jgi:glycosyltransferase involved in cell wall biosynthesis